MNFDISLIDILRVVAVVVLLIAIFIPKKNGYEYNSLDKKGVIFNIVLSCIYVPLSIASIFTSAITRKRGKSKFSFIIQFLPILVFVVMIILMFFMDKQLR